MASEMELSLTTQFLDMKIVEDQILVDEI